MACQLTPQQISADVNLAKCNLFSTYLENCEALKWGITCKQDEFEAKMMKLRRCIWLLESNCLTDDQICRKAKELNRMHLIDISCQTIEEALCNAIIPCSNISITVSENQDCNIPTNSISIA